MTIEQTLQTEIDESNKWLDREHDDSTYKRDLQNMKNPNIYICALIESKMNEIIDTINQTDSIMKSDKLHSELSILEWILYQVCRNEIKRM